MHVVQNHVVNKRENTSYILGDVCKLGLFCLNALHGKER